MAYERRHILQRYTCTSQTRYNGVPQCMVIEMVSRLLLHMLTEMPSLGMGYQLPTFITENKGPAFHYSAVYSVFQHFIIQAF